MKTYMVRSDGADESVAVVAEKIESLAHELRSRKETLAVIQSAEAIMHLAADIVHDAEKRK